MKGFYKQILLILLTIILSSAKRAEKQFDEYEGGRFMYSWVNLKLYSDSTYYYSEGNHTGRSINDHGKWGKINDHFYLNSTSKTRWTKRRSKSDKFYLFQTQEFIIKGDTLRFIPKDEKNSDYYNEYYKLHKVRNSSTSH